MAVTDHGYRSVSGVPYPLDVNSASLEELTAIPGLGTQRAGNVLVDRPYERVPDIEGLAEFATVEAVGNAD